MSCVRPSSQLDMLQGKNFNVGHYTQTVLPNVSIPAMLIGTIDFCHFVTLLLTLVLPGGHNVSAKLNFLASFSCMPIN